MVLLDTNILLYAFVSHFPQHDQAKALMQALARGRSLWGVPVFCLGEFVRVFTHPRLFKPAHSIATARGYIDKLLAVPNFRVLSPGPAYPKLFLASLEEANALGNLAFDAQIAASMREFGRATLISDDHDFARFQGLDWLTLEKAHQCIGISNHLFSNSAQYPLSKKQPIEEKITRYDR